jgi:ABC-type lipoprotein export system ATPase subunit
LGRKKVFIGRRIYVSKLGIFAGKSSMATDVEIVKSVEDGHNVIITGQAGTGKSIIINELYQLLVRQGKNVIITATTGIASTMFPDDAIFFRKNAKFVYIIFSTNENSL